MALGKGEGEGGGGGEREVGPGQLHVGEVTAEKDLEGEGRDSG